MLVVQESPCTVVQGGATAPLALKQQPTAANRPRQLMARRGENRDQGGSKTACCGTPAVVLRSIKTTSLVPATVALGRPAFWCVVETPSALAGWAEWTGWRPGGCWVRSALASLSPHGMTEDQANRQALRLADATKNAHGRRWAKRDMDEISDLSMLGRMGTGNCSASFRWVATAGSTLSITAWQWQ